MVFNLCFLKSPTEPLIIQFPVLPRNVGMGTSTASARVSAFASAYAPLLVSIHCFGSIDRLSIRIVVN